MARIRIDDLAVAEALTPEQEALLLGAGLKSFRPSLEALEGRDMPSGLAPLTQPVQVFQPVLSNHVVIAHQGQLSAGNLKLDVEQAIRPPAQPTGLVVTGLRPGADGVLRPREIEKAFSPGGASLPRDPLSNFHRRYIGLNDLRKGDIFLNTTEGVVSEAIRSFSNSSYNHAAIYVGNGKVVEAMKDGVRLINLTDFLKDDRIVRSMVLRKGDLTETQRQDVVKFALAQVGKPYNVDGARE